MTVLQVLLVVLAVAFALWLVYQLRSVIVLLVLSIFAAYLISPLVTIVSRPFHFRGRERCLSKGIAIGVVYLVLFGLLTVLLSWLIPRLSQQVADIGTQAPAYMQAVQGSAAKFTALYDRLGLPASAREEIERTLATFSGTVEGAVRSSLMVIVGLLGYLPWLVLIPILAFFFLKDGEAFRRYALSALPPGRVRSYGVQLFDSVNAALAAYIRAQLIACVLVGFVVGVGFALLRVPYTVLFAVAAGLAEFVPLVGPLVIAVVAAIVAALQHPILAVWVLIFLGVLRILEDYVVYPRLVGHTIDLHPLAIIIAVLAGAELGGVIGVFLAVPAIAVASAAYRQYLAFSGGQGLVAGLVKAADGSEASGSTQ